MSIEWHWERAKTRNLIVEDSRKGPVGEAVKQIMNGMSQKSQSTSQPAWNLNPVRHCNGATNRRTLVIAHSNGTTNGLFGTLVIAVIREVGKWITTKLLRPCKYRDNYFHRLLASLGHDMSQVRLLHWDRNASQWMYPHSTGLVLYTRRYTIYIIYILHIQARNSY